MKKQGLLLSVLVVAIFAFGNAQVATTSQVSTLPILEPPVFSQLTAYPVIRIVDGDTIVIEANGFFVNCDASINCTHIVHKSQQILVISHFEKCS